MKKIVCIAEMPSSSTSLNACCLLNCLEIEIFANCLWRRSWMEALVAMKNGSPLATLGILAAVKNFPFPQEIEEKAKPSFLSSLSGWNGSLGN